MNNDLSNCDIIITRLASGGNALEVASYEPLSGFSLPAQFRRGEYVTFMEEWLESQAAPGLLTYQFGQYPAPKKVRGLVAGRIEQTQIACRELLIEGVTLFSYYRRYAIHIEAFKEDSPFGRWQPFGSRRNGIEAIKTEVSLLTMNPRLLPYGNEVAYDGAAVFPKIEANLERMSELLEPIDAAIYAQVAIENLAVFNKWTNIHALHADVFYRLYANEQGELDPAKLAQAMRRDMPSIRPFKGLDKDSWNVAGDFIVGGVDSLDDLPETGSGVFRFEASADVSWSSEPSIDLSWLDMSALEDNEQGDSDEQ